MTRFLIYYGAGAIGIRSLKPRPGYVILVSAALSRPMWPRLPLPG